MLNEKIAYIRGLAEGPKLKNDSNEGKIIMSILDALESIRDEFEYVYDEIDEISDQLDENDEYWI